MSIFWHDGRAHEGDSLNLPISSPALLYGATIFTTLRLYQQNLNHPLTHWQAHCRRLASTVKVFGWNEPDWSDMERGARFLGQHYPVLRLTIFPDSLSLITGRDLPKDLEEIQSNGVKGWVAEDPVFVRSLAQYKTGNYLGPWLAKQKAHLQGQREAILLNKQGHWLESATGNLWGYSDGIFYTPQLSQDILPGIARGYLVNSMERQNIRYQEVIWDFDLLSSLETIAYSNSVVEVVPFYKIEMEEQTLTFDPEHHSYGILRQFYPNNLKLLS